MGTQLLRIALVGALLLVGVSAISPEEARADTNTLRPNGAGSSTNIPDQTGVGAHWQLVDEAGAGDGLATSVFTQLSGWREDLYAMQDGVGAGLIESVTVYIRSRGSATGTQQVAVAVRTLGSTTLGDVETMVGSSFTVFSETWALNPTNSLAWTWTDIDNIEAGLQIRTSNVQPAYCTQVWIEVEHSVTPTLVTNPATNITINSATLNGNMTSIGAANTTSRGFDYGLTTSYGLDVVEAGNFATGAYEGNITSLSPGTLYHFRAKATNSQGTGTGSDLTFTTLPVAPTVSNRAATRVSVNTARLNGSLDSDGGNTTTVSTFWGPSDGGANSTAWANEETLGVLSEGLFNRDISGLSLNTTYYFRSRATNSEGEDWADTSASFTTDSGVGAPTNLIAIPDPKEGLLNLNWVKGGGSAFTVIRYGTTIFPGDVTQGTAGCISTGSSCSITDLDAGVTYLIRAWGQSGNLTSEAFVDVQATMTIVAEDAPIPDVDTGAWFTTTDYTRLANVPLFSSINDAVDSIQMSREFFWMMLTTIVAMTMYIAGMKFTRGSMAAGAFLFTAVVVGAITARVMIPWIGMVGIITVFGLPTLKSRIL